MKQEYYDFLATKKTHIVKSGFKVTENDLNPMLFDFQKYCVVRALESGKFALLIRTDPTNNIEYGTTDIRRLSERQAPLRKLHAQGRCMPQEREEIS